MPLYEYQCLPERHSFEVRHGMNEDPVSTCVICGGPVRRVIQPVGIVFKGSGFYVNDSRKSSSTAQTPTAAKAAEGATESSTETSKEVKDSSTESKKEAKPATSAETPSKPAAAT